MYTQFVNHTIKHFSMITINNTILKYVPKDSCKRKNKEYFFIMIN